MTLDRWANYFLATTGSAGVWIVLSRKDMANYKGPDPAYKSKYIKILVFTQAAICHTRSPESCY
ncbi:MAG: hypothetical protein Q8918_15990 [Bacteroidota bacterium]|nr:hypothetical protein [Bacteroidota bacterium]MDP4251604.1 hypothetical protein [Bacteroidota bacterium]